MVAPELPSKINERRVLEFVQASGPPPVLDLFHTGQTRKRRTCPKSEASERNSKAVVTAQPFSIWGFKEITTALPSTCAPIF